MDLANHKGALYIAGGLGLVAVGYIAYTHSVANAQAAQAAADSAQNTLPQSPSIVYSSGGVSGGYAQPSSTFSTSGASGNTNSTSTESGGYSSPTSGAASTSLAAIAASLQTASQSIATAANQSYDTNATQLFASLPASLSAANMSGLHAQETQGANGQTTFDVTSTYNPTPAAPASSVAVPASQGITYGQVFAYNNGISPGSAVADTNAQWNLIQQETNAGTNPAANLKVLQQYHLAA